MSFDRYFDKIYCINLENRNDRWTDCENEFRKQDIRNVIQFKAVDGISANGESFGKMGVEGNDLISSEKRLRRFGCLLSHLNVIMDAKSNNYSKILLLEDDVQFIDQVKNKFDFIEKDIPPGWSLLYFGGNEKQKSRVTKINDNVVQVYHMLMAHAVGIDCNIYDVLINELSKYALPVDVYYTEIQKRYACYAFSPFLAWQRAGWSDIEQRFRIYDLENMSPSLNEIMKCD